MTDIRFLCPECQSKLTVDEKGAGRSVPCPICGKQVTIPPLLSVPISITFAEPQPPPRGPHPEFPNVGNLEAVCPHCNQQLEKRPGKKKQCPHCGQFMYVRTRPSDEQQVLVTEAQADQIAEQWSIVNGTHDAFLAEKKCFADEKAKLAKRFGRDRRDAREILIFLPKIPNVEGGTAPHRNGYRLGFFLGRRRSWLVAGFFCPFSGAA